MFNICLVEDEKNLNNLIKTYLEKEGYNVIQCFNGKEALDVKEKVDLWILDIMLGDEISGYDIIKSIRAKDMVVPVIFTSARDQELDKIIGLILLSNKLKAIAKQQASVSVPQISISLMPKSLREMVS